jgi:hypothetical protein
VLPAKEKSILDSVFDGTIHDAKRIAYNDIIKSEISDGNIRNQ